MKHLWRNAVVYGGAFNPVTKAHLAVIHNLLLLGAPTVIVTPSACANAEDKELLSFEQRAYWLIAAIRDELPRELAQRVVVSEVLAVMDPALKGRTWHFLDHIKETPKALVVGTDQAAKLPSWYRGPELLQRVPFWVLPRQGQADVVPEALSAPPHRLFTLAQLAQPIPQASSTEIREHLRQRTQHHPHLPYVVWQLLYNSNPYRA